MVALARTPVRDVRVERVHRSLQVIEGHEERRAPGVELLACFRIAMGIPGQRQVVRGIRPRAGKPESLRCLGYAITEGNPELLPRLRRGSDGASL